MSLQGQVCWKFRRQILLKKKISFLDKTTKKSNNYKKLSGHKFFTEMMMNGPESTDIMKAACFRN